MRERSRLLLILLTFCILMLGLCGCVRINWIEKTEAPETEETETGSTEESGNGKKENERETPEITTDYPRTSMLLTNRDIYPTALRSTDVNSILVIHVTFTDSPEVDEAQVRDMFLGEYDADNCLRSVRSYFEQVTYGQDLLDFSFARYDSDMTVEEAYHYINDEDENGDYVGMGFLYDIFRELLDTGAIDTTSMDRDGDGYVDGVVFMLGDYEVDGCVLYGGASGSTTEWEFVPDVNRPTLGKYVKISGDTGFQPITPGAADSHGTRTLLHEMGHLFGLNDYYDCISYEGNILDTLGGFDMQSIELGDWNSFSRLTCGFVHPYVITEEVEQVTLKLRCSSLYDDVILIPTSAGWNGTPFDEYLLIDVFAKGGANGFDWGFIEDSAYRVSCYTDQHLDGEETTKSSKGGVRILHVDNRLAGSGDGGYYRVEDVFSLEPGAYVIPTYWNSNGVDPIFETDSRFYHQVELVPADGSSRFRISSPECGAAYAFMTPFELFSTGDSFSMETHTESFTNGTTMNNGGTMDYEVYVEYFDPETLEAVVTITKK